MSDPVRLIALVDASPYAEAVCRYTAWIAGRYAGPGARVDLFHVIGRREGGAARNLSGAIGLGARSRLEKELAELDEASARLAQEQGRAILQDAGALIAGDAGRGPEVFPHLRQGDLVETITRHESGAELIVLGKRGEASDFARGHLGSNLERVVRASARPVFVAARAFRPIARVMIAFDGSPMSLRAVELATASPLARGLEIRVAFAGPEAELPPGALDTARRLFREAGGEIAFEAIDRGASAGESIASHAEVEGFDLIVMGAYGHSRLRSMIIGSTTSAMLRGARLPMLLLR